MASIQEMKEELLRRYGKSQLLSVKEYDEQVAVGMLDGTCIYYDFPMAVFCVKVFDQPMPMEEAIKLAYMSDGYHLPDGIDIGCAKKSGLLDTFNVWASYDLDVKAEINPAATCKLMLVRGIKCKQIISY